MIRTAALVTMLAALAAGGVAAAAPPNAAELEAELVCPVCKATLDQSNAPVAQRMKVFIRVRIAAGDSEQKIKDALVAEFGTGVLAEPPRGGFEFVAWRIPLAVGGIGIVVIAFLIRRWSRRSPAPANADELDPKLERLVDDELARFDG